MYLYFVKVQSDLIFLGFLVMQNKLKPQSSQVIQQLRIANIKCVMVTGENIWNLGIYKDKYLFIILIYSTTISFNKIQLSILNIKI